MVPGFRDPLLRRLAAFFRPRLILACAGGGERTRVGGATRAPRRCRAGRGGMREMQPGIAGREAAERGSYWGWTLAAVFLHVAVLLWARCVKPALPGAIDEWSPTGSADHEVFADAYARTARELRVKSAKLGVVLSLLLHGGAGFVGLYDEIRTWMAFAAERRAGSVVEEALRASEPSAEVATRSDWGPWPAAGAWAGTYGGPGRFAPRKPLQVTFGDLIEIRWADDGCGGTLEPAGRPRAGRREYVARLTWGRGRCIDEGTVVLTRTGSAAMGYMWRHPSSRYDERGTLEASSGDSEVEGRAVP